VPLKEDFEVLEEFFYPFLHSGVLKHTDGANFEEI
jgi:hypothetical protein